jgi:hypothetical protein
VTRLGWVVAALVGVIFLLLVGAGVVVAAQEIVLWSQGVGRAS